jgi:hypothetical protein
LNATASRPAKSLPGICPATPIHPEQIRIAHRLHLLTIDVAANYPVTATAGEIRSLLNGFWQETRRADTAEARLAALATQQAEDRLESLLGPSTGTSPVSAN